ncbi:hypothetical protein CROQUDRAFT_93380 [Cronartium quercuum f. sp. fusiforme G11]|uniref:Uncharacterized protein n=1 Tax=Cronartium quercuum f. sp. fusiforme G11 TaxID=708437 RepID=A0A9P6NKF9_9BASI|nr:hypothetical protein CROQUDRAFT_93380 [Cronartium quercuum f. sp. fusiforme G11]
MVKNAGDRLKDDGSNYANWEYRVTRLIEMVTGKEHYLDDTEAHLKDPCGDRVVFSIIDLLVPVDVGRWLSGSTRRHGCWDLPSKDGHDGDGPRVRTLQVDEG